jgi:hypothetical protein
MRTGTAGRLRAATGWARQRGAALIRRRRAQLVVAVLFGALLGGGFVAASTGLSEGGHGRGAGFSVSQDSRPGQPPQGGPGSTGPGNDGSDDSGR